MTSLDALRLRHNTALWDRIEAERCFGLGCIELPMLVAAYLAESEAWAAYTAALNGGQS